MRTTQMGGTVKPQRPNPSVEGEMGLERLAARLLAALRELREDQAYRGGEASLSLLDQAIRDRLQVSGARLGLGDRCTLPTVAASGRRADWSRAAYPVREAAQLVDRLIAALGGVPDADEVLIPCPPPRVSSPGGLGLPV